MRSLSGFITPPGRRSASNSSARAFSSGTSTATSSPHSVNFHPRTFPFFGETTCVFAPAASRALRGSISSTCSKPSVTRIATFSPCKSWVAIFFSYGSLGCDHGTYGVLEIFFFQFFHYSLNFQLLLRKGTSVEFQRQTEVDVIRNQDGIYRARCVRI